MAQQNMYDWTNVTQNQLANMPNVGMPNNNNGMQALQNQQQRPLRTGKNPNPKFPRLRDAWEGVKEGGGRFLFGDRGGIEQAQKFNPQENQIFQLLQMLGVQGLQNPYAGFEPIEEHARNQFSQHTLPNIAERFTSLGNSALSSGTFKSQRNRGAAELESELAAQKAGYSQQNFQQAMQLLAMGLQPKFQNIDRASTPGVVQHLLGNAGNLYQTYQMKKLVDSLTGNKGS